MSMKGVGGGPGGLVPGQVPQGPTPVPAAWPMGRRLMDEGLPWQPLEGGVG